MVIYTFEDIIQTLQTKKLETMHTEGLVLNPQNNLQQSNAKEMLLEVID